MNAPAPTPLDVGLHADIPMERYIADPCIVPSLSGSIVDELLTRSPRHAWFSHPRLNPKYQPWHRGEFDIGSAAHSLLLEQDEAKLASLDPKDYPGKRGGIPTGFTNDAIKAARDVARSKGKIPLLREDAEAVREMLGVSREYIANSQVAGILDDGASEVTMVWDEGPTWFRCRPDRLTDGTILHYKTTKRSAEPNSFGRMMMVSMGYDTAAIFYERGYAALHDGRPVRTVFLVQEQEPPYCCSLLGLDGELADHASIKVERAIQLWAHCMRTGKWPAYSPQVVFVGLKPWQAQDFEERALTSPVGQVDRHQLDNEGYLQA